MVSDRLNNPFTPVAFGYARNGHAALNLKRYHGSLERPRRDIFDYALFLPCIWLMAGLGFYLRLGGPIIVLAILGLCAASAVLRVAAPPKWLTAYVVLCVIAALLSQYRLFPSSWQEHFRYEAIVRQFVPTLCFFVVAWASKAYFLRRLPAGDAFSGGGIVIFLSLIIAPAILFQQGFQYEGDSPGRSALTMYGSFTNNIIIGMFYVTALIFVGTGWRRRIGILIMLAMLAVTYLAQFWVITAVALAILLGAPGRVIVLALISAFGGLYLIGLFFIPEIMTVTPNSAIRLAFIVDTLKSIMDTYSLGIGYGTESVRFRYNFPGLPEFTFILDPGSLAPDQMLEALSTGVHNSYFQALLRTGVLGLILLVAAFVVAFPPRNLPRKLRNHAAVLFSILFIACWVNPALESPVQGMGVGFAYGYLVALRAYSRSKML